MNKYHRFFKALQFIASRSFLNSPAGKHAVWATDYAERISDLKMRLQGEDCFLLCNGPSLNKVDFDLLTDFHVVGLNKINLLLERIAIELAFHVAINSLVIEQSYEAFNALSCPSFWAQNQIRSSVKEGSNTIPIVTKGAGIRGQGFTQDIMQEPVFHGNTVTYVALQLLYSLGVNNVFIVGMDHYFKGADHWSESPNSRNGYFTRGDWQSKLGEVTMSGEDTSHFDPRYFSGEKWELPDIQGSEMNYMIADFVYFRNGRRIYDATEGGHCQIFEKLDFKDAITKCRPKVS